MTLTNIEYKYDEFNRCIEKQVPQIGKSTYDYDITEGITESGYVAEKTVDPKGNETFKKYDKVGRLSSVKSDDVEKTYEYYANGARKSEKTNNGLETKYTYDNVNQLKTLENKLGENVLENYSYDYDKNGNMIEKTDKKGKTTYTYDELNRLDTIIEPADTKTSYSYDKAGNRLTETKNGKTANYKYDERNRLTELDKGEESYTFEYDNNGNEIKETKVVEKIEKAVQENVFNEINQVVETKTDENTIKNTYNADGYRVEKSVNDEITKYLYENDKVVLETDKNNNETAHNVYGTNLVARTSGENTYSYMYNGNGDVTGLLDKTGQVKASYYYNAFGNPTESTGDVNNPYTFNGYQYDKESGMYYLNSRYYDPEIARFISEDTFRGEASDPLSLNIYTYCENNPLIYTDPTGHWSVWGAVKGFASAVINEGKKVVKEVADWTYNNVIVPVATWTYNNVIEPIYNNVVKPIYNKVVKPIIRKAKRIYNKGKNVVKRSYAKLQKKIEAENRRIQKRIRQEKIKGRLMESLVPIHKKL